MNQSVNQKIAILLAVCNGGEWLKEQLDSLLNQSNVDISIFISIDPSIDNSLELCNEYSRKFKNIIILPLASSSGSGSKNFYRLLLEADIKDFDFVAFSDQDDIWESHKLYSHIQLAIEHGADGVSSNVIAFWPNGKKKLIIKSQPQKKWDYLFESAGPGCTFLMTPWLVNKVREQLNNEHSPAKNVALHDWLTYAICRAYKRKWVIDTSASVHYRQHQNNVIGANSGLKAKISRLLKLKHGWYRSEVAKLCTVCASISDDNEFAKISSLLTNKNIKSQMKLLDYVAQARRKYIDQLVLYFSILFFIF